MENECIFSTRRDFQDGPGTYWPLDGCNILLKTDVRITKGFFFDIGAEDVFRFNGVEIHFEEDIPTRMKAGEEIIWKADHVETQHKGWHLCFSSATSKSCLA